MAETQWERPQLTPGGVPDLVLGWCREQLAAHGVSLGISWGIWEGKGAWDGTVSLSWWDFGDIVEELAVQGKGREEDSSVSQLPLMAL